MPELPLESPLPSIPLPANEAGRLEALRQYYILDTPPEKGFDRITSLAVRLFNVPIALVSLVDQSRAWFKSCHGFELQEVQREDSLCSFALLFDEVLVVPDTQKDQRFACNPFVQMESGLRFYAGAPLLTQDGFNLGTLCLLDTQPWQEFTLDQQAILLDLAAMVMDELELRLAVRKVAAIDTALLEITQGVAATTGNAFFAALVQHFTKTLGIDYSYIGLVDKDHPDRVKTIATCAKGQIIDNFEYRLDGTPCWEVIQKRTLCFYSSGVQGQFPQAPLLEPLGIESYAAIPFFDSRGRALGLLGIMDSKPLVNIQLVETLLPIFALRIATELERQHTEVARQQAQQELERLVTCRTAELSQSNELLQLEILERQRTEVALQKEQEMLRVLLDNVQAAIVACNAEGLLTLFNRAAREFHNLPEQPLPPAEWASCYNLYMPDGKTPMPQEKIPLFRALQGETVEDVELVIAPQAGTPRTMLVSGQAIVDHQGNQQGAVVVMHDITERKQAEAERVQLIQEQAARLEAEAANRMKDEFLAILSHELRTPLNPILGWSKLLQHKSDPDTLRRGLQTIERNAKLQTQLIADLLDVSRILRGKLSLNVAPVTLQFMIETAIETVQMAAEAKGITLSFVSEDGGGNNGARHDGRHDGRMNGKPSPNGFGLVQSLPALQVMGDASRLQQIVWNLLTNAIKFTPDGGQVQVRLERLNSSAENSSFLSSYAQITVRDTGKGITPDFLPYVFDRFRQADSKTTRKFGGLGLGLSIVRQLVELHGGTVEAESSGEGQGATFIVKLPLAASQQWGATTSQNQPSPASPPVGSFSLAGLRLLVVDDEPDARELLAVILEQEGATVTSVSSAMEALQALSQSQFDMLISDIGMPQMDGYTLMQQVTSRVLQAGQGTHALPKAIALTAYAGELNQQKALSAGFQCHLSKPLEPTALIAAITHLIEAP